MAAAACLAQAVLADLAGVDSVRAAVDGVVSFQQLRHLRGGKLHQIYDLERLLRDNCSSAC